MKSTEIRLTISRPRKYAVAEERDNEYVPKLVPALCSKRATPLAKPRRYMACYESQPGNGTVCSFSALINRDTSH